MVERANATGCARANDLIAFLYDEVSEYEARDFELHLQDCSECKSEVIGFRQIRQSVVAWRDESLSGITASVVGGSYTPAVSAGFRSVPLKNRSAVAAVREFFALSPLWMKGGVALASVLFCVVASLAVSHLLEKPSSLLAHEKLYTETELKTKVAEGIRSLAQFSGRKDDVSPAPNVARIERRQGAKRKSVRQFGEPAFVSPQARRRPLTKSEREQLAADLRLTSPNDDEGLDLLDDRLSR